MWMNDLILLKLPWESGIEWLPKSERLNRADFLDFVW